MLDVLNSQLDRIQGRSRILDRLGLKSGDYVLATVHRAENTRDTSTLRKVISCLEAVDGVCSFRFTRERHSGFNRINWSFRAT